MRIVFQGSAESSASDANDLEGFKKFVQSNKVVWAIRKNIAFRYLKERNLCKKKLMEKKKDGIYLCEFCLFLFYIYIYIFFYWLIDWLIDWLTDWLIFKIPQIFTHFKKFLKTCPANLTFFSSLHKILDT